MYSLTSPLSLSPLTNIDKYLVQDEIQKSFKVSKNASNKEKLGKNILSGGCAGSLSLLFVQSIDYTRTRLGVDARNPAGQRQFSGIVECYVKTVKADGVRGLYRGFWISCCCIFIYRYISSEVSRNISDILIFQRTLLRSV